MAESDVQRVGAAEIAAHSGVGVRGCARERETHSLPGTSTRRRDKGHINLICDVTCKGVGQSS